MAIRSLKWFEITGPADPTNPGNNRRYAIYHSSAGGDTDPIGEGADGQSYEVQLMGDNLIAPNPPFTKDETMGSAPAAPAPKKAAPKKKPVAKKPTPAPVAPPPAPTPAPVAEPAPAPVDAPVQTDLFGTDKPTD